MMNERIKQLADQARFVNTVEYPHQDEVFEKFAELIVKECINTIESRLSSGENSDQWTITRDVCYHFMIDDLKEHFGVE
jgi:hypothetical protein